MENTIEKNLGYCLRARGMSELRFAMLLGVDEDKVRHWLDGTQVPEPDEIAMMAQVLEISENEFLQSGLSENVSQTDMFSEKTAEGNEKDEENRPKTGQENKRAPRKAEREYKYIEVRRDTAWAKVFVVTLIVYVAALILALIFTNLLFFIVCVLAEFISFYAFIAAKKHKEDALSTKIFYADIVFLIILNIVSLFSENFGTGYRIIEFIFDILCIGSFLFIFEDREEKIEYRKWAIAAYIAYSVCSALNSFVVSNVMIALLLLAAHIALFVLLGITKRNRYIIERIGTYSEKVK